jgi:hypothetical protein
VVPITAVAGYDRPAPDLSAYDSLIGESKEVAG